jgi:hypothetical protein
MYLGEFTHKTRHVRHSKLGAAHEYYRTKTMLKLRCDNCDSEFVRERSRMSPERLNNNFFHVCENCDAKSFAQKRGVEKRKVWQLTASSSMPIGKI